MKWPEDHKTEFTAKDIERYHAGQMSAKEMHDLERAALDDPFLADALEGFVYSQVPEEELAQVKKRLSDRSSEKRKVRALIFDKTWIKIAALFLVLAGAGLLVYLTMVHGNRNIAMENRDSLSNSRMGAPKTPTIRAIPLSKDSAFKQVDVAQAAPHKNANSRLKRAHNVDKKPTNALSDETTVFSAPPTDSDKNAVVKTESFSERKTAQ